jgi:hypothetical protein
MVKVNDLTPSGFFGNLDKYDSDYDSNEEEDIADGD